MAHQDYLVPSLRCIPISKSKFPKTLDADWVAPNAVLIGDIKMGDGSSYGMELLLEEILLP